MTAIPLSSTFGGPLSGLLLQLDSLGGLRGWQWLFLIEGLPACALALVVLKFLPNGPAQASFLSQAEKDTITLVPDGAGDGTNVLALPTSVQFQFAYGASSFQRHLAHAFATGIAVAVRRDSLLCLDIDVPADLTHPLVQEVLPAWLPTNLANPNSPPR
jgi:MFS family permease